MLLSTARKIMEEKLRNFSNKNRKQRSQQVFGFNQGKPHQTIKGTFFCWFFDGWNSWF